MSKVSRYGCLLAVVVGLLFARPLTAAEEVKGNLVNVNWLEKNLKNDDVLILDASPAENYAAQHIPAAISVDIMGLYGLRETPIADMEKLFQSWGISPGKDDRHVRSGRHDAGDQALFLPRSLRLPRPYVAILDGGLSKWLEKGLPVTKDVAPVSKKGSFTIKKVNEEVRVRLPEFLTASGDPVHNVLLEALGADWHYGQVPAFNKAGHIPHAVLLPSGDFFNPDKTFKSPEDITKMLAYLGIRPEQQIYTHCGGGVAASVPFFALKFLANFPKVKLFQESRARMAVR